MAAWNIEDYGKCKIKTPVGMVKPIDEDNVVASIFAAAKDAGLRDFNVKVDGNYVDNPTELDGLDFTDVETVELEAYDTAG